MSASPPTKPLSFWSLFALGVNGIVGVGIFYAPAEVMSLAPGMQGAWVYLAAALALLPVALVFGKLGQRFTQNGGPYVWAHAAFGSNVGFGMGWLAYLAALLSTAAVLRGLGDQFGALLGADPHHCALAIVAFFTVLSRCGLRLSAFSFRMLTVLKLLPLAALLVWGLRLLHYSPHTPLLTSSSSLGRATLTVVFALQGFEVVPVLAGEARNAGHVRRATWLSLITCAVLYALLHAVCVRALGGQVRESALVDAAEVLAGEALRSVVLAGQLVCGVGIAFGQIVTTPYYLVALGNDSALGSWWAKTRPNGVPPRALWMSSGLIALFVLRRELASLFVLSSVAVLSQYAASACSLWFLTRRTVSGAAWRDGWLSLLSLSAALTLASSATFTELLWTLAAEGVGFALLWGVRIQRARYAR